MPDNPQSMNRGYIKTLDTVRAIAILMVLVQHSGIIWYLPLPGRVRMWISSGSWGQFGVVLFFVLSGFLITRILISSKGKQNAYKNFLIRRSLRIFPIYFILIFILLIFDPGRYLIYCAAYVSNYAFAFNPTPNPMSHAWSLSVEEHFYLIWPPIVLFLSTKASKASVSVIFPAISILSAYFIYKYAHNPTDLFYRATNVQIFALSLGSLLAFHENWLRRSWRHSLNTGIGLSILGALLYIILSHAFHLETPITKFYAKSIYSAAILCLFLSINDSGSSIYKSTTSPAIIYIGKISYGLYLYHFPIYFYSGVFPAKDDHAFFHVLISTLATVLVAIISYHVVEKPILRLKKNYS